MATEVKSLKELFDQLNHFDGAARVYVDSIKDKILMSSEHDSSSDYNWSYLFSDELDCYPWDELPFSDVMISLDFEDLKFNKKLFYRNFFNSKQTAIIFIEELNVIDSDPCKIDLFNDVKEKILFSLNNSKCFFIDEDSFNINVIL